MTDMRDQGNYYGASVRRQHRGSQVRSYGPGEAVWFRGTEDVYECRVSEELSPYRYFIVTTEASARFAKDQRLYAGAAALAPRGPGHRKPSPRQL